MPAKRGLRHPVTTKYYCFFGAFDDIIVECLRYSEVLALIASKRALLLFLIAAAYLVLPATAFAQEGKVDLSLRFLPEYYYKEVTAGEENTLFVEIRNNGDEAVTDITFDSEKPPGWAVDFAPRAIAYLGAGSSQTINVKLIPDRNVDRGDYNVTIVAEANETRSATSTMVRIQKATSFWLWVGLGIGAIVIAGFVIVYFRFGRQ